MSAQSWFLLRIWACVLLVGVYDGLGAAQVDEPSTQVVRASFNAETGGSSDQARIRELELTTRHIREFMDSTLPPAIEPASLFDVELQDDAAVTIEAARLQVLLNSVATATKSVAKRAPPAEPHAPAGVAAVLWDRRLALDHARLDFYRLPGEQRTSLLEAHATTRADDAQTKARQESSEAEQRARAAEAERRRSLEAAQRARSEAQRTIAEERARLLAIASQLAEQEVMLADSSGELAQQAERTLILRREVRQLLEARNTLPEAADNLYLQLRTRLRAAREELASLFATAKPTLTPVRGGEDALATLPAEISRKEVDQLLTETAASAKALLAKQLDHRERSIDHLYGEVQTLNADRLALLPRLSESKRQAVTGFTAAGVDQALAEVRQLMLVLRYHTRTAFQFSVAGAGVISASRVVAAGTVAMIMVKTLLAVGALFWIRRFAAVLLVNWRERVREQSRRARSIHNAPLEDLVAGLLRILPPTSWLLSIAAIVWVLPAAVSDLLEVQILVTVGVWSLGGWLAVGVLDSLAKGRIARFGGRQSSEADHVRLRSLRMVAMATVAIGLLLSLSRDIVGTGTIYSWVASIAAWMVLPLGLLIVHWWRPIIFQRIARVSRKGPVERWVLAEHGGRGGLIAAAAGGAYLFAKGVFALIRSCLDQFQVTRHVLAYLFRQQLERIERSTTVQLSNLSEGILASLCSSKPSVQHVDCADDVKLREIAGRIERSGCGAYAVVGERGSGRSTVLHQLLENHPARVVIDCPIEGSTALIRALARALDLPSDLTLQQIATWLDSDSRKHIIAIDNAHRLIRPIMGGLADFDILIDCARRHSTRCAWVLTLDRIAWLFYARARPAGMLFDAVVSLGAWTEKDIANLLQQRSREAQIEPRFDRLLPEMLNGADDYDRRQVLSRLASNYYDLIWDYAAGNPGVALHTWRNSLGVAADGSVQVTPFKVPDSAGLDSVPNSAVFVLRAVLQLEQASIEAVASATMLGVADVEYALRFGEQCGYLERIGARYAITWNWYRPITRFLQRRHLLAGQ